MVEQRRTTVAMHDVQQVLAQNTLTLDNLRSDVQQLKLTVSNARPGIVDTDTAAAATPPPIDGGHDEDTVGKDIAGVLRDEVAALRHQVTKILEQQQQLLQQQQQQQQQQQRTNSLLEQLLQQQCGGQLQLHTAPRQQQQQRRQRQQQPAAIAAGERSIAASFTLPHTAKSAAAWLRWWQPNERRGVCAVRLMNPREMEPRDKRVWYRWKACFGYLLCRLWQIEEGSAGGDKSAVFTDVRSMEKKTVCEGVWAEIKQNVLEPALIDDACAPVTLLRKMRFAYPGQLKAREIHALMKRVRNGWTRRGATIAASGGGGGGGGGGDDDDDDDDDDSDDDDSDSEEVYNELDELLGEVQ